MTEQTNRCAHHNCYCPAPSGSEYGSDYCAKDEDDTETGGCEHPECLAHQA